MSPDTSGVRFYVLRRNPWRHGDRIDTLAGVMFRPAAYDGDYLMVLPRDTGAGGRSYYPVYDTLIPGNRDSLGYDEVTRLAALHHAGYRRVPLDALPPAWQRAFRAELAAVAS